MNDRLILRLALGLILSLSLVACLEGVEEPTNVNTESIDSEVFSTEAMVDSLDKAAQDFAETGEVVISSQSITTQSATYPLCSPPAYQQSCSTEGSESFKEASYDDCQLPDTRILAEGNVELRYNNTTCSLSEDEDQVTRQYDIVFDQMGGRVLDVTSQEYTTYRNDTFGGGESLANTETGWEISYHGRHYKLYSLRGRLLANVSIKTESPIVIEGSLGRQNRVITGGAFRVDHNRARFSAVYEPVDLTWNETCRCPVSGSMGVTFTGSITGGGSVSFESCGKAKLERNNGFTKRLSLESCEL